MHDLKSRYDIGWFSAYDTLKGMVVLYGADKVLSALAEITGGLTPLAGDGGGLWACPKCSHENDAMAIKCFFCDAAAPKA